MKRSRLFVVIIWCLYTLGAFLPLSTSAASDFTYNTDITYRAENDSVMAVTEAFSITNNTARQYLSQLKLYIPSEKVDNLRVTYDDGTVIPATAKSSQANSGDIKYDVQEINISFSRQNYGLGRTWKFRVSYKTAGLLDTKGNAHTVYIPAVSDDSQGDGYKVTVDVPAEYGTPHFAGAFSSSSGLSGGRQLFHFSKADLVDHSLALAFGDSLVYHTNFNFPLKNDAPWPQTLTVALPPDLNNQKSYIDKLSPTPNATHLDEDGNVLADYSLNGHQQITVTTDVSTEVKFLEYDLGQSGTKKDIPADLVKKYTKGSRYWQTDGEVADAAKKLVDDKAPVINNVKAVYDYVINKLTYNEEKIKFNIRQGAKNALDHPNNVVCLEYADLMVAMLRSQGIPARMPIGYAYSGSLKNSSELADSLHAWVEAYVPGIGWMTFDPTWGEKFNQFGKSDLDHFAFAVWGENDSAPVAVANGSFDTNYQYEATKLDYKLKVVPVPATGSITVWRWVILPFVSLDHIVATAGPQVASDDNAVQIDGATILLGSLAPGQKAKENHVVLGGPWNATSQAKYVRGNQNVIVLAATQVKPNYAVMIALIVLVIVGVAWHVLRLRKHKEPEITQEETIT